MGVSTPGSSDEKSSPQGIVFNHAYTLAAAHTLENGEQLVKIRNPWGKGEWTGDWSDNSPLWTPKLKKQFGWTGADDGSFFMRFSDFLDNYTGLNICYYNDGYKRSSICDVT